MKYIRIFEEFIQDPVNVEYEIKQMIGDLKKIIESDGFKFNQPYLNNIKSSTRDISLIIRGTKNNNDFLSKIDVEKLNQKLNKFFKLWMVRFEKTNNLLTFSTEEQELWDKGQLYLEVDITIKGIKYFKWRYKKGQGKKLFHFSETKNREFILKNGISPTMNTRWSKIQKDLATNQPAVYAMPPFDISGDEWKTTLNRLFNKEHQKTSLFSILQLIKEGKNFKDYVERNFTFVPNANYSFNATNPNFKILTPWAVVVDEEIQKLIDNRNLNRSNKIKIDESKFIDTTGEFKLIDGVWSDIANRDDLSKDWNCYVDYYMIDLWEIDLDKIDHEWWLDPVVNIEYNVADNRGDYAKDEQGNYVMMNFNKLDNWNKWLISYSGVIPTSAIKIKQSFPHRPKSNY